MHARKTFILICFAMITAHLCGFGNSIAHAQSGKYKRQTPKKETPVPSVAPAPADAPASAAAGSTPAPGTPASTAAPGAAPATNGEKVDISELEQRYWAPKDTEFSVVQNRLYSKAKRFALTASWGPLINDTYADGSLMGASLNYYFTERTGVELMYHKMSSRQNIVVQGLITKGGLPDHNLPTGYTGLAFNWVPFYAKMSVLEKKIIYFDMSFSPGVGVTTYDQQVITEDGAKLSAFTFSFDVAQHFFLDQHWAIRFDMRNRFMTQNIVSWRYNTSIRDERLNNTSILIGVQYYH